tara:strand:+ start:25 stop:240 length:216 start_codon:yes stop_codon:yes gene_type:complete
MLHPLDVKKIAISNILTRKDKDLAFIEGIKQDYYHTIGKFKRIIVCYFCNKFRKKSLFFGKYKEVSNKSYS